MRWHALCIGRGVGGGVPAPRESRGGAHRVRRPGRTPRRHGGRRHGDHGDSGRRRNAGDRCARDPGRRRRRVRLAAREATGVTDERGIFRAVWRTGPAEDYAEASFHVVDYTARRREPHPSRVACSYASCLPMSRSRPCRPARTSSSQPAPRRPSSRRADDEIQVAVQRGAAAVSPWRVPACRSTPMGVGFLRRGRRVTGETDPPGGYGSSGPRAPPRPTAGRRDPTS